MVTIIVAAHGESAPALLATARMILGNTENVHPVTFAPGEGPEDLIEKYRAIMSSAGDSTETLILVDLFGGSPYNAAARVAAEDSSVDVVSGVNVPMLIETISAASRKNATLASLVKKATTAGTKGVRSFQEIMNPPAQDASTSAAQPAAASATTTAQGSTAQSSTAQNAAATGNGTMTNVFTRIDSRLIHGQVAGNWANYIGPQTLIAASDSAAKDKIRKTLLLQVAPSHIKTNVLDIAKTGRVFKNPKYTGMKTMFVVEGPQDVLRLMDEGVEVKEVNVGGVTYRDGYAQLSEAVYASPEDIEAYKELDARGVKMTIQQLPNTGREDMMKKLKEKGLI